MSSSRIKTFIGFSVKAGKILYGVDNITAARKRPSIILYDSSLSKRSREKLTFFATTKGVNLYALDMEEYLPGRNIKAIAITDTNLAKAVETEIKEITANE